MRINRDKYLEKLIQREHNGLIKIITGIRRCGKSCLLFNIFRDYLTQKGISDSQIIEVALDDIINIKLRDAMTLYKYVVDKIDDKKQQYYIFLDEIQYVKGFEDVLNGFLHIDNVDVYVTGSNSKFLSTDIITEFRGRGDEVKVYPLSFSEFQSAYDGSINDAWQDYYTYGGMPLVAMRNDDESKIEYLSNLFEKIYISDIIERNRIRRDDVLENLINILASSVGSLTNPTKLANTYKSKINSNVTDKTLKQYIDYLLDAFLIDKVMRYDVKGKKYIGATSKYYFVDVGLRNARLDFRQQEENHIMENIIYNELKYRGYNVDVGVVDVWETEKNNRQRKHLEVDFIANKGSNKYYIQSALRMINPVKEEQEKKSLRNIDDTFKKIVLIKDNIKVRRDESGIVTVGLHEFLLDQKSLDLW